MAKNNPTKKQIDVATHRRVSKLSLQIAKIDLNYELQLLTSEYQKYMEVFHEKVVVKYFPKFT